MLAAGVILFVVLAVAALFVGGRIMARSARKDAARELARLRGLLAWHEERLRQAKSRNGDHAAVRQIAEQVEDTRFQLLQVSARARS